MPDYKDAAGALPADLTAIGRVVSAVPGVREAVAIIDRQVLTPRRPAAGMAPAVGTPIPDDRPAISAGPASRIPDGAAETLVDALQLAASLTPDRGTTYVHRDGRTDRQTYAQLLDDGCRALAGLRRLGVRRGEPVLLQCADSRSFVTGFWACVLGGYLPTPVAPAPDYQVDGAATRTLRAAWQLLDRPLILSDTDLRPRVAGLSELWAAGTGPVVASLAELTKPAPAEPVVTRPDEPVLNLLTSGSTGMPKCVQHTNRSIAVHGHASAEANGFTENDVTLNWMPLDHVGGIVMSNVRDTFLRCAHVTAPTAAVISNPLRWLDWIESFRATNTWAPNFAFALVNKHSSEIESGSWDLSSMRHICNGGEAVVARTAFRFLELLAPHGLPPDAIVPVWGMSETSSAVTYAKLDLRDRSVGTVNIDSGSLDRQLRTVPPDTPQSMVLTEAGTPIAGVTIRVVDDAGSVLPEGRVGRLQVTGDTMMREYFGNPAANRTSFLPDGWFDTGDLGFLRDGRLTLTGRHKDMVIVNGANYPVHDVETVVEQVPGVRPTCVAVCSEHDDESGTDAALVFFVPTEDLDGDLDGVVEGIRTALTRDLGFRPRTVVPVTVAEFPRTPSGKVQRARLAEMLANGSFDRRRYDVVGWRAAAADDSLMECVWEPASTVEATQAASPTLLYAPADSSLPAHLERLLRRDVGVIRPTGEFRIVSRTRVDIDPAEPGQHEQALAHVVRGVGRPTRVAYAWEAGTPVQTLDPACVGSPPVHLLTTLAALARVAPDANLTVLTRAGLDAGVADPVHPARAAMVGMVRTANAEGMFASARLVDVPPDADDAETARLALTAYDGDVVAVRDGVGYAPRLRVLEWPADLGVPHPFLPPKGTVLLSGGLGGLGRTIAEHLVAGFGARLLIVGRTPAADLGGTGADVVLDGLRELGDVRYTAADVADPAALERAVVGAERQWDRQVDMVIHLAGTPATAQWNSLGEHELVTETASWLGGMLRPKLGGCAALEALLDSRLNTSVVLFSSVLGFFGGWAFGAYAAASAAVDGFARRWSMQGRAVRCVAWSMWSGPGMNEGNPLAAAAQRRGQRAIDPSSGLAILLAALNQRQPYLLAGVDPTNATVHPHLAADQFAGGSTLVAVAPDGTVEADIVVRNVVGALAEVGELAQVVLVPRIPRDAGGLVDPIGILAARDRPSNRSEPDGPAEAAIANILGEVLELAAVGRDDSFFVLGGDSIRAMRAMDRVNEWCGLDLPVSVLYENPTVRDLAKAVSTVGTVSGYRERLEVRK